VAGPAFDGSQAGPPVGYYTYTVDDDHWSWSDGMYALHGFEPGEVPATTEVMLAHKHPDDRARTFGVLEAAIAEGGPFSCYHRVIDKGRRVRSVLAVGRATRDERGKVDTLVGFFIDLTDLRRSEGEADLQAALLGVAENRAVIDQAKGIVMLAEGCDEDDAFAVLRQYSQNANIKLNDLAHRLVKAVGIDLPSGDDTRRAVTGFLDALR
jgi:ANTAR domain/PAS fold